MRDIENESMKEFNSIDILNSIKMSIEKTYKYYEQHENIIINELLKSLNIIFSEICIEQKKGDLKEIGYINITPSRINIHNKEFLYPVYVYGANWYLDLIKEYKEIDFEFAYKFFNEGLTYLLEERKKYINKISISEVEQEVYRYITFFNNIIVRLFRNIQYKIQDNEEFKKIIKSEKFCFYISELYESPDKIFIINKKKKSIHLIKKMIIESNENNNCNFEDFTETILENMEFEKANLIYSNFDMMKGDGLIFIKSKMLSLKLRNSTLRNVKFLECDLNEADFTDANLENVEFYKCNFEAYNIFEDDNKSYQYNLACFENASIKKTEFSCSFLKNINFSKSELKDVCFSDSELQGCIFLEVQVKENKFLDCTGELKIIKR